VTADDRSDPQPGHRPFHIGEGYGSLPIDDLPYDRLCPDSRSAGDDAARAGTAHWEIVAGHWCLRRDDPEQTR